MTEIRKFNRSGHWILEFGAYWLFVFCSLVLLSAALITQGYSDPYLTHMKSIQPNQPPNPI
jgi:hypothetical protein